MIDVLPDWTATDIGLLVGKTTLLLGATWLVSIVARRRSAAERHFIWLTGMVGVGLMPLFSLSPWRWDVPLPLPAAAIAGSSYDTSPDSPGWHPAVSRMSPDAQRNSPIDGPSPLLSTKASGAAPGDGAVAGSGAASSPTLAGPRELAPSSPRGISSTLSRAELILLLWSGIAAMLLVRIFAGHVQAFRHARQADGIAAPGLVELSRRIEDELGMGPVRMLAGATNEMPKAGGLIRPWLVLPSNVADWPRARQESVLRHELAHVRRRDTLWELVVRLVCALYWFNPLVWLAAARLRGERENACDDLVLLAGTSPADYAADLLSVARQFSSRGSTASAAIAMARPSRLRLRLTAVLGERRRTREAFGGRGGLIAAGGLPLLLAIGVMSPVASAEEIPAISPLDSPMDRPRAESGAVAAPSATPALHATASPVGPFDADSVAISDRRAPPSGEPWDGVIYASAGEELTSVGAAAVNLERVYAEAATVRYQVTATLKRSDETAPMVPARLIGAVRGNTYLERLNVDWGGTLRQAQTLSASFSFPDEAALDAWLSSEGGRAFQAAVDEAAVEGTARSSMIVQPVH